MQHLYAVALSLFGLLFLSGLVVSAYQGLTYPWEISPWAVATLRVGEVGVLSCLVLGLYEVVVDFAVWLRGPKKGKK